MKVKDIFNEMVSMGDVSGFPTQSELKGWLVGRKLSDIDPKMVDLTKYQSVASKLKRRIKGGKIKLYRAVSVFDQEDIDEWIKKNRLNLGTSWTWDKGAARPYRYNPDWEKVYILTAEVPVDAIDINATLALNMSVVRGDFEREIRLKDNAQIHLVAVDERKVKLAAKT